MPETATPGFVPGMRKNLALILALLLGSLAAPAPVITTAGFAQAPPPVPAEPDAERRTRYAGVSNVSSFPVGFDVYGDGTDFTAWVELWVNGIKQTGNWSLTLNSGSFTTLSRPLLAANLNIVFTTPQSGTVDIVGARRPRRLSQLQENRGVTARDFNQIVTDLWMTERERWDRASRTIMAPPGETLSNLPPAATRANTVMGFNGSGDITTFAGTLTGVAVSAPMVPVVQAASLAVARAALGTDNASNLLSGTINSALLPALGPLLPCGIDQNTTKTISGNYTIIAGDCAKTLWVNGVSATIALPAPATFAATPAYTVRICNGNPNTNTQAAHRLSGFPDPLFARLYMMQCAAVKIVNGVWQATEVPGRFRPAFTPNLFIDTGGSDANSGLVSNAAGNALASVQKCISLLDTEYDLVNTQPECRPTGGQTIVGSFQRLGTPLSSSVFWIRGNGGIATLRPTPGGSTVLTMSDFAGYVIVSNITLDCTGGAANCYTAFFHQESGADFFVNSRLNGAGTGNTALLCDTRCKVNFNSDASAGIIISGTFGTGVTGALGSAFVFANGLTLANSTTISGNVVSVQQNSSLQFVNAMNGGAGTSVGGSVFQASGLSTVCLITYTNSWSVAPAKKFTMLNGGILINTSATVIVGTAAGTVSGSGYAPGFAPDNAAGNTGVNAAAGSC